MREAADFFQSFQSSLISGINTSAIGQIERFDGLKADVKLLPGGELLTSVPVAQMQTAGYIIRVPYQKDDYVLVTFCMRDIDGIMHEDATEPTERMLSLDDAVVVCGLNLFTRPLPTSVTDANDNGNVTQIKPDDLMIATKDFVTRITLPASGGLKLYSDHDEGIEIAAPMGVTIRANNPAGRGINMIDIP